MVIVVFVPSRFRQFLLVSFLVWFFYCCILGRVFWLSVGGDGFQTQRRKSWILGTFRAEKLLAHAITIDGRKERIGKFCSETNVWIRWCCRRCFSNIAAGLQRKHKEAVFAKNKEWCSGSSSTIGEEERWLCGQDEVLTKLCAQVELLGDQQGVWKGQEHLRKEETVLKRTAKWKWRKRRLARKSWMIKGKVHRGSCGTLRSLRAWTRF